MMAARTAAPLPSLLMICLRLVRFNSFLFSSLCTTCSFIDVPPVCSIINVSILPTGHAEYKPHFHKKKDNRRPSIADKGERDTSIRNRIGHDRDI